MVELDVLQEADFRPGSPPFPARWLCESVLFVDGSRAYRGVPGGTSVFFFIFRNYGPCVYGIRKM